MAHPKYKKQKRRKSAALHIVWTAALFRRFCQFGLRRSSAAFFIFAACSVGQSNRALVSEKEFLRHPVYDPRRRAVIYGREIPMTSDADADQILLQRICAGNPQALGELFVAHRERLRRMVQLRLDRRLQGRVDPSDVIQEAFVDAARRLAEYTADPAMPPFLWLRFLTAQRLVTLHRVHLGVKGRDAGREVSLHSGPLPSADSRSLAAQLLGRIDDSEPGLDSGRDPDQDPGCTQRHGPDRP